jgi:hypothetical protein
MYEGGQQWLKCFIDGEKRGPHVWHGRSSGEALWLGIGVR